MKIIFKRFIAYTIDIVLVTLIANFLSSNVYLNKDYDNYMETYEHYNKYTYNYQKVIKDLDEYNNDLQINEKKYQNLIESNPDYEEIISKYYKDIQISEDDYSSLKEELNSEHKNKIQDYSYKISKLSIMPSAMGLLCILMYFVAIQYCFYGQTLGKKLMKIKVVSNKGKELTILNFFVRSIILNNLIMSILNIIFILVLSKDSYIMYDQMAYTLSYVLEMTIIFTIIYSRNNRGIHDVIAGTKVVDVNNTLV